MDVNMRMAESKAGRELLTYEQVLRHIATEGGSKEMVDMAHRLKIKVSFITEALLHGARSVSNSDAAHNAAPSRKRMALDEAPDHKGRDHEGRDAAGNLVLRRCMFDWPIFLKLLTGHTKTMHMHDAMTKNAFYELVRIISGLDEPRGIGAAT